MAWLHEACGIDSNFTTPDVSLTCLKAKPSAPPQDILLAEYSRSHEVLMHDLKAFLLFPIRRPSPYPLGVSSFEFEAGSGSLYCPIHFIRRLPAKLMPLCSSNAGFEQENLVLLVTALVHGAMEAHLSDSSVNAQQWSPTQFFLGKMMHYQRTKTRLISLQMEHCRKVSIFTLFAPNVKYKSQQQHPSIRTFSCFRKITFRFLNEMTFPWIPVCHSCRLTNNLWHWRIIRAGERGRVSLRGDTELWLCWAEEMQEAVRKQEQKEARGRRMQGDHWDWRQIATTRFNWCGSVTWGKFVK